MSRIAHLLILITITGGACIPFFSWSTHLVGGNISYEYLGDTDGDGDHNYAINFRTYLDCNSQFWGTSFPEPSLQVGVYEGPAQPSGSIPRVTTINMPLVDSTDINPEISSDCGISVTACYYRATYIDTIDLPVTFSGYHLFYDRCCRNNSIVNLNNPGSQGMVFNAYIGPTLTQNSSPVFSDVPVPSICVDDTASILNTAVDPDGDLLVFSFVDPFRGYSSSAQPAPPLPNNLNFPIPTVNWATNYNKNQPFGPSGHSYINGSTGYTEYMSPNLGPHVVAIEIKEYRNGSLIGTTRRDLQIVVTNCPDNPPPNLSTVNGSGQKQYTIEEGDSLCFPIDFYDPNGDSTDLVIDGSVFDSNMVDPPATADSLVIGDDSVSTEFCWNTSCGQAQALPYLFTASATDKGCPPKTTNTVYEISVTPPTSPEIIGPMELCEGSSGILYHTDTIHEGTFNWSASGGTIVSGGNNDSVTVDWNTSAGSKTLTLSYNNVHGCPAPDRDTTITIINQPFSNTIADTSICWGDTISMGGDPSGPVGSSFNWTPSGSLSDPTAEDPDAFPTSSTEYILTVTNPSGCSSQDTVNVTVGSAGADAGPDTSMCEGDTLQLQASGGGTYAWGPSDSLSDTTIADPQAYPDTTTVYYVEITDGSGCTAVDSLTLTVHPVPEANAGPDTSLCAGDSLSIGGSPTGPAGSSFAWSPASSLSDTTLANPTASPASDTTYHVWVITGQGCANQDSTSLTVHPVPTADAGNDTSLCQGDSVQLQGSGGGIYAWEPSKSLNDTTLSDPWATPSDTTRYYLTITTPNNCMDRDSIDVIANPLPIADTGPDRWVCPGDSSQLQASGGSSYAWSPSSGLSDTSISDPWAKPADTTKYTVQVIDTNNCSATDSLIVAIGDEVPTEAGPDTTLCEGDSVTLGGTPTSPVGSSYNWWPSASLDDASSANPRAAPSDTTTFYVMATNDTCTHLDSVTVNVVPSPATDVGNDTAFCTGDSVRLQASGGTSYAWSPSVGLNDTSVANPWASPKDTTQYNVQVTDAFGCQASDSLKVIVNPLPTANASPDTAICSGDSVQLQGTGGIGFTWTPNAGLSNTSTSNPWASPSDTTSYRLVVTDTNGCQHHDSVRVVVDPLPVASAGQDTSVCQQDSVQLEATGGSVYAWTPSTGLSDTSVSDPWAAPSDTTEYFVRVTDTNQCMARDSMILSPYPAPPADAGNDTSICAGDSVLLNATGGVSYTWSPQGPLTSPNTSSTWASPTDTAFFKVIVEDGQECIGKDSVQVIVDPLPTVSIAGDAHICRDDTAQLTASGAASYSWSPGVFLSNPSQANTDAYPTNDLSYTVTGTDSNNCRSSTSILVDVFRVEAGPDTNLCENQQLQLYTQANGAATYQWIPTTGLSDTTLSSPWAAPDQPTTYQVIVTDTSGCQDSATASINTQEAPNTSITSSQESIRCDGLEMSLSPSPMNGDETYFWNLGEDTVQADKTEHSIGYNSQEEISLITENENGCLDTATLTLSAGSFEDYYDVTIPNVFTPNGDDMNDVFTVQTSGEYTNCTDLKIYNRWGQLLFVSTGNNTTWSGRNSAGMRAPEGTYIYTLVIKGKTYKGTITLLE